MNDSIEFVEIIPLIKEVLSEEHYSSSFREFLLNSKEICELEEYKQFYIDFSRREHDFKQTFYHTYACSFSTNSDSLSMWNYYGTTTAGPNVIFDFAWNMFKECEKTEVDVGGKLSNDIMIYRGLILYSRDDKKKCVAELLNRLVKIFEEVENDLEKYKGSILYAFKGAINNMRCFF